MKTIPFIILAIFILPFPIIAAEETSIHDGWHEYQDFFTIGDDYYEVTTVHLLNSKGDEMLVKTLLKRNQASFIITAEANESDDMFSLKEESCKAEGVYRYCITDISFEPEKGARSDETGYYHYGTRIVIYEEQPEYAVLEFSRAIQEATLPYGEETKVNILVSNKGIKPATDVMYQETIGEGLEITRHEGFDYQAGDSLIANLDTLYKVDKVDLRYWVRAEAYQNSSTLSAVVNYSNPDPASTGGDATITIPWPFGKSFSLSPTSLKPNHDVHLTYTAKNLEDDEMSIVVTAKLDQGILLVSKEGWERVGNKLLYAGTLEPNTEKSFSAYLTSPYTGTYDLTVDLEAEVNGYHHAEHDAGSFEIKTDTITSNVVLSKEKMRSGEPITIGVYLHNEDDQLPFFNIQGWAGTDFFNETIAVESIAASKNANPLFKTYRPPAVTEQTTHTVMVSGTFITKDGEEKKFYTQEEFIVLPENQSIILGQTMDKTSLKRGEELTVTIDAENIADSGSHYVNVIESFDQKLEHSFGDIKGSTFLYGGENRQLYVYKLKVPYDYTKGNFTITSRLTAKGQPVTEISKIITVTDPLEPGELPPEPIEEPENPDSPEQPEEPIVADNATTPEQPEEPTTPEPEDKDVYDYGDAETEEKEGFIKRIIRGIADFFSGFFS